MKERAVRQNERKTRLQGSFRGKWRSRPKEVALDHRGRPCSPASAPRRPDLSGAQRTSSGDISVAMEPFKRSSLSALCARSNCRAVIEHPEAAREVARGMAPFRTLLPALRAPQSLPEGRQGSSPSCRPSGARTAPTAARRLEGLRGRRDKKGHPGDLPHPLGHLAAPGAGRFMLVKKCGAP